MTKGRLACQPALRSAWTSLRGSGRARLRLLRAAWRARLAVRGHLGILGILRIGRDGTDHGVEYLRVGDRHHAAVDIETDVGDPDIGHDAVERAAERAGLLRTEGGRTSLTEAGRDRYAQITTATTEVTARLYADLPAEDLAVAGRLLTILTERANAELAS